MPARSELASNLWIPGLLGNQGEKSIDFYFIRVPLRKKSIDVYFIRVPLRKKV